MKTSLDPGPRSFPYFLAITTQEEYDRFVQTTQGAFARRFQKITIEKPTDKELITIMGGIFQKKCPEVFSEDEILNYILEARKKYFADEKFVPYQVDHAIEILNLCIELVGEEQFSSPDTEELRAREELSNRLSTQAFQNPSRLFNTPRDETIFSHEAALQEAQETAEKNEAARTQFFRERKKLLDVRIAFYRCAIKIAKTADVNQTDLTHFYLMGKFLLPEMEKALMGKAEQLEIKTVINQTLVNQVIKEMVSSSSIE